MFVINATLNDKGILTDLLFLIKYVAGKTMFSGKNRHHHFIFSLCKIPVRIYFNMCNNNLILNYKNHYKPYGMMAESVITRYKIVCVVPDLLMFAMICTPQGYTSHTKDRVHPLSLSQITLV